MMLSINRSRVMKLSVSFTVTLMLVFSSFAITTSAFAKTPAEGVYLIESALKPGLYLDVKDAKAEDFSEIQLAGPGDQTNRRWRLILTENNKYAIETALKPGFFLDVQGAKSDDFTPIQLGGKNGRIQQNRLWNFIHVGNGEYLIETALKKNAFLDVRGAKAENFTKIQLGSGRDQPNRRWRLIRIDVTSKPTPGDTEPDDSGLPPICNKKPYLPQCNP